MRNLKKILRIFLKTIIAFVIFIVLYMLSVYFLPMITIEQEQNTKLDINIYILTNGVHTDIVVPAKNEIIDWTKEIKYANNISKDTTYKYLAMGWGDKGFYLETPEWSDLTFSVAFKAATGLSTTAIHATYHSKMIEGDSCKKIPISIEQYKRLVEYITNTFQEDANGHYINIKTNANYGETDAFYEAEGSYSMFYTCNSWANSALKSCGQRACLWTPFDTGIFSKYE